MRSPTHICCVKTVPFEYYACTSSYEALNPAFALGAFFQGVVSHILKLLKSMTAFIAFILIGRHILSLHYRQQIPNIPLLNYSILSFGCSAA